MGITAHLLRNIVVVAVVVACLLMVVTAFAQEEQEEVCMTVVEGYPQISAGVVFVLPSTVLFQQGHTDKWKEVREFVEGFKYLRIEVCKRAE